MTNRDKVPAIFFFFFSLYICIESLRLNIGNWRKPGAGFFPFCSGIALGILAVLVLFKSWKVEGSGEDSSTRASWRGRILCFLSLLIFIFLLDTLGFILTSFLFIGLVIRVVERKGWVTASLVALFVALASYGLFQICLQSQLPKGILGF